MAEGRCRCAFGGADRLIAGEAFCLGSLSLSERCSGGFEASGSPSLIKIYEEQLQRRLGLLLARMFG